MRFQFVLRDWHILENWTVLNTGDSVGQLELSKRGGGREQTAAALKRFAVTCSGEVRHILCPGEFNTRYVRKKNSSLWV